MKNVLPQPRIRLSLTVPEMISFYGVCSLGKLFARPEDRANVKAVLARAGKQFERLGAPPDLVARLVKL